MNADSRAKGCLLGQLAGDALGSQVEFQTPGQIIASYPEGLRELTGSPVFNTLPGQPTDDSEMALLLARMLADRGTYSPEEAFKTYTFWLESEPFDCGSAIRRALTGNPDPESRANGAMMRISPLGIFGAKFNPELVGEWAAEDAKLTHPNPVCTQANSLYANAISHAIASGCKKEELYNHIVLRAKDLNVEESLLNRVLMAAESPPEDFMTRMGWVLIAFQNSLWQLLHSKNTEEGIVDTLMRGGDTDTNAAIAGALLGAVNGVESIPQRWIKIIINCRPEAGKPGVNMPRPECFWPADAPGLAEKLLRC